MAPVITKLVERAQSSGDLRPDFAGTDVKMIVFMLSSVAEYASASRPDLWRRYLALLIDGLRAARDTVSELPAPAPTADDIEAAMCSHGLRSVRAADFPGPTAAAAPPSRHRSAVPPPIAPCTCIRTDDGACIIRCINGRAVFACMIALN